MTDRRVADPGPVLVFDSGIGGLSVLRALRHELPAARFLYVADDAAFPYGDWEEAALRDHVVTLISRLVEAEPPAAIVIACNTASTLVLPALRARHDIPFVGTVPAIKPAAERTKSGVVAVLATPGTIRRDYTRELIRSFAQSCHVRLVGAPDLARLAEAHMRGERIAPEALRNQIAPCFVTVGGQRTDIVVLACTHYPFLAETFAALAPWPVEWLDPAPAIARRAAAVVAGRAVAEGGEDAVLFTSGTIPPPLLDVLRAHGLAAVRAHLKFDIPAAAP